MPHPQAAAPDNRALERGLAALGFRRAAILGRSTVWHTGPTSEGTHIFYRLHQDGLLERALARDEHVPQAHKFLPATASRREALLAHGGAAQAASAEDLGL